MAIIAVLAGMVLGALGSARSAAKRAQAADEINSISLALKRYYGEYGTWPSDATGAVPASNPLSAAELQSLYLILVGTNINMSTAAAGGNVRKINFLESLKSSRIKTIGGYVNLVDPWGTAYQVRLDDAGDQQIPMFGGVTNVYAEYGIWSKGQDLIDNPAPTENSNKDNVTSWQLK